MHSQYHDVVPFFNSLCHFFYISDPVSVLICRLIGPRKENCLREVDAIFVKKLKKQMSKSQFVPFKKPLVCIVKGLFSKNAFKKETLDGYELEVIGGNHRRVAMQGLASDHPDNETLKMCEAILFTG